MTFLSYNFSLSVSSHLVLLVGPLIFMCWLGTQVVTVILSCCVWEGPETCINHMPLFLCCAIGHLCSNFEGEENGIKKMNRK